MILYPALDLMGGRCVRLRQGDFAAAVRYEADPLEAVRGFAEAGAGWAHVVDLDGARAGAPRQHALIARIAASAPIQLQVAGGFRAESQVRHLLEAGAARVVIGSLAVQDSPSVRRLIDSFGPERIALALDVHVVAGTPQVAIRGWTEQSGRSLWDVAQAVPEARHILITDIGRDGMMAGPNLDLMGEAVTRLEGRVVQASGGVATLDQLDALQAAGAGGAIVGKALWEGRFTLEEALAHAGA